MAQDSLKRLALLVPLVGFGVACEVAGSASPWWAILDLVVGCTAALAGVELLGRSPRSGALALAFTVLWFLGTASEPFVLAYRGPLLQLLLLAAPRRRLATALAAAGWVAGVLPFRIASPVTTAVAALAAVLLLRVARLAAADARSAVHAAAVAALGLAAVWGVASAVPGHGGLLLALNDVAVLGALVVAFGAAGGFFAREAERALVIELGPSGRAGLPLTTRLGRALADPELDVRYLVPGLGWVDERGHEVAAPPESRRLTRAAAPGGGEVVLVHGQDATADSQLAQSAAAAAALSLETARLDAEVRLHAREVDTSRRRLLTAVDDERRLLEQRLSESVLVRLRRVDRLLSSRPFERERRELWVAVDELVALGRGLYPPSLARSDLTRALHEIASRCGIPVTTDVVGDPSVLSEPECAAVWFVCSEALTNVERHAGADNAHIRLRATEQRAELEVEDDGRGGARLERGLRGLADRVETLGGRFELSSPPGGPTVLRAVLPVA